MSKKIKILIIEFFKSFWILLVFSIFFGIIYPLCIIGIANLLMPFQAKGSIISVNGEPIGSLLIGQTFTNKKYFHSRLSSCGCDPMSSGGDNLGPTSQILMDKTKTNINKVRLENNLPKDKQIPGDMVLNSASGLDPDITITNAMLQLPRIAKLRKMSLESIKQLVMKSIDPDFHGLWGQKGVNVLKLNLLLDNIYYKKQK